MVLCWIGEQDARPALIESVRAHVSGALRERVHAGFEPERPSEAWDPRRGQFESGSILEWLASRHPGAHKVLGVTDVDLFIPILTFVFGEAQLGGRTAVVSTARLGDAPFVPGESARIARRLEKEAVHELGHTFGLLHCRDGSCAMARSPSLRHVDAKLPAL
ncbi:MAG TPA: hypothetical protein VMR65_08020, partial [Candidatus Sulfotelmatobacter sp.]|nr:hypothetical protein [Candidatus Sulfotelmatobacter sp.]